MSPVVLLWLPSRERIAFAINLDRQESILLTRRDSHAQRVDESTVVPRPNKPGTSLEGGGGECPSELPDIPILLGIGRSVSRDRHSTYQGDQPWPWGRNMK